MSDEHDEAQGGRDDALPSVEQVARLDAALDRLVDDRRPEPHTLSDQEAREHLLAAQLRLARSDVEAPSADFLQTLERTIGKAVEQETRQRRRPRFSRAGFMRSAAALAAGAGLGVAGIEGASIVQDAGRPHDLVEAGNERWYDVAAHDEVQPGGIKPFNAGGVMGFLLNDDGHLHAVSAICTHMGCRLKPTDPSQAPVGLHCLCHDSRFDRQGTVVAGLAPQPLPRIAVRVDKGRVYALGTRETV